MSLEKQVEDKKDDKGIDKKKLDFDTVLYYTSVVGGLALGAYLGEHINKDLGTPDYSIIVRYGIDVGAAAFTAACTTGVAMLITTIKGFDW